jgi:hypothetical protein
MFQRLAIIRYSTATLFKLIKYCEVSIYFAAQYLRSCSYVQETERLCEIS